MSFYEQDNRPFTRSDYAAIVGIAVCLGFILLLFFWPVTSL